MLQKHQIIYPDGSNEIIEHYGMFPHNSGGFAFYVKDKGFTPNDSRVPYIFISGTNVRKIIPLGAV